jgi:uncharacterized protein YeeX (DUF496 family)
VLAQKKARVELSPSDVIAEFGLSKSIDNYDKKIRDEIKRSYLLNDPIQLIGHNFSSKQ